MRDIVFISDKSSEFATRIRHIFNDEAVWYRVNIILQNSTG